MFWISHDQIVGHAARPVVRFLIDHGALPRAWHSSLALPQDWNCTCQKMRAMTSAAGETCRRYCGLAAQVVELNDRATRDCWNSQRAMPLSFNEQRRQVLLRQTFEGIAGHRFVQLCGVALVADRSEIRGAPDGEFEYERFWVAGDVERDAGE